jgi:hypothetical protein
MVDRYKDVVKSGGENVSSIRVESVLHQHPAVQRASVIGLPDDRWGEAVTAVVAPRNGHDLDKTELIAFCRARLAGYETPKRVVVRDELPTMVGDKVFQVPTPRDAAGSAVTDVSYTRRGGVATISVERPRGGHASRLPWRLTEFSLDPRFALSRGSRAPGG